MVYFVVKTFLVNLEGIIPSMVPASYAKSILKILAVELEVEVGVRLKEMAEMGLKTVAMGEEIDKMENNKIKANLIHQLLQEDHQLLKMVMEIGEMEVVIIEEIMGLVIRSQAIKIKGVESETMEVISQMKEAMN